MGSRNDIKSKNLTFAIFKYELSKILKQRERTSLIHSISCSAFVAELQCSDTYFLLQLFSSNGGAMEWFSFLFFSFDTEEIGLSWLWVLYSSRSTFLTRYFGSTSSSFSVIHVSSGFQDLLLLCISDVGLLSDYIFSFLAFSPLHWWLIHIRIKSFLFATWSLVSLALVVK